MVASGRKFQHPHLPSTELWQLGPDPGAGESQPLRDLLGGEGVLSVGHISAALHPIIPGQGSPMGSQGQREELDGTPVS